MADQDPSKSARADLARIPGLLDHYRQQKAAWLAQADELARMREEVRQAAEREALEIVTSARSNVRRIIVEARRELLVLTAQLHAAVEATDAPSLPLPPFGALLADPDRAGGEGGSDQSHDITREVVLEARKGVRSVLDEARAEIEALTAEAPAVLAAATSGGSATAPRPASTEWHPAPPTADDEPRHDGPVHELSLDSALSALDFQTRDLPIPTLAHILGTDDETTRDTPAGGAPLASRSGFEPLSLDTSRFSELRTLLREAPDPFTSVPAADRGPVLSPDVEPSPASPLAFDTTPRSDFFASLEARADELDFEPAADAEASVTEDALGTPHLQPPSRLFGHEGETRLFRDKSDARHTVRSARTFIGLFAVTGALAIVATLWWALTREGSEPLSAAAPAAVEGVETPTPVLAPTNPPGTMALTIEARRPSWIRAQIDGKDEEGRLYQTGEIRHIEGARAVSIRAGDAGAVFVTVDGAAAQALGPGGRAATKQFTAPAPLATPAVTTTAAAPNSAVPAVAVAPGGAADVGRPGIEARTPPPANLPPNPPAAATAAPVPANVPAAGEGVSGAQPDLVQAGQQWLDAYQRRDRDSMAATGADNITVSDERSVSERFPAWQSNVRRDLDMVELELTGDTAVLTARMTEHAEGGQAGEHVSRVSQIWQRRNGRWRLASVRLIGEARLNQIIR